MADGTLERIPTDPANPYPLGRAGIWHDPRNRQFRALAEAAPLLPERDRRWVSPPVFDQGQTSSCAFQSAIGVLSTTPNRVAFKPFKDRYDDEAEREAGYLRAQLLDPFPGQEPESQGTSTDAPFQVLRQEGIISGWKWLFGFDEMKQFVMYNGPVSVGTNWYQSMFTPDSRGFLSIDGQVAGGHCWRVVGYSTYQKAFRMVNSWGRSWGDFGRGWVKDDVMRRLLEEQGEVVTPTTSA